MLIRDLPDINPGAADEIADAQYLLFQHRSPTRTAAEYVRVQACRNPRRPLRGGLRSTLAEI